MPPRTPDASPRGGAGILACHARRYPATRSRMPAEREPVFLKTLTERSLAIQKDPVRVKAAWEEYCTENHNYFMSSMLGHNRLLRRLNRDTGAIARLHSDDKLLLLTNILRCDIHRETALTVLSRHFALKNGRA